MLTFGLGLLAGVLLTGIVAWQVMPDMMLEVQQSPYDSVEETCDHLAAAIEADEGWANQSIRDMNASMAKHGVELDRPVRVVELCNAYHAKTVLDSNPEVSTMMPCAWGVYEGEDGNVYVSGMNMGLMGQLFGGTIAEVMGGVVAEEEEKMLDKALGEAGRASEIRTPPREPDAPRGDGAMSKGPVDVDPSDVPEEGAPSSR
jgi:uncharacterized protein (DUF302 family)